MEGRDGGERWREEGGGRREGEGWGERGGERGTRMEGEHCCAGGGRATDTFELRPVAEGNRGAELKAAVSCAQWRADGGRWFA